MEFPPIWIEVNRRGRFRFFCFILIRVVDFLQWEKNVFHFFNIKSAGDLLSFF